MPKRLLSTASAFALLFAPIALEARCYNGAERTAVEVRVLQTELMVAALSCRAVEVGDLVGHYNEFVRKHGERLVGHSRILQAHFQRHYGPDGQRRLEAFMTALANDASHRSMASPQFCPGAAAMLQDARTIDRRELEDYSAARAAAGRQLEACAVQPAPRAEITLK